MWQSRSLWSPGSLRLSWCRMACAAPCTRSWWTPGGRRTSPWICGPSPRPPLWFWWRRSVRPTSYTTTSSRTRLFWTSAVEGERAEVNERWMGVILRTYEDRFSHRWWFSWGGDCQGKRDHIGQASYKWLHFRQRDNRLRKHSHVTPKPPQSLTAVDKEEQCGWKVSQARNKKGTFFGYILQIKWNSVANSLHWSEPVKQASGSSTKQ